MNIPLVAKGDGGYGGDGGAEDEPRWMMVPHWSSKEMGSRRQRKTSLPTRGFRVSAGLAGEENHAKSLGRANTDTHAERVEARERATRCSISTRRGARDGELLLPPKFAVRQLPHPEKRKKGKVRLHLQDFDGRSGTWVPDT